MTIWSELSELDSRLVSEAKEITGNAQKILLYTEFEENYQSFTVLFSNSEENKLDSIPANQMMLDTAYQKWAEARRRSKTGTWSAMKFIIESHEVQIVYYSDDSVNLDLAFWEKKDQIVDGFFNEL